MNMLTKAETECFEQFYSLLERSFPEDERRSREAQRALFDREEYRVLACSQQGRLVAFLALWDLGEQCFIEHFAVEPELRGQGLGARLLGELASLEDRMIVLEAELPENEQAARRIGFYRRNGYFTNDRPYTQPAYSKDKKALPMVILSHGRTLEAVEFEKLRKKLYSLVYDLS